MRQRGDILHGRPALVLGFGKLGSSIARLLHVKGVRVIVYDIDPVRRAPAMSQGFEVARDRDQAIATAGLVLCATGALSLRGEDFPQLRNGAYVATVTSSEDELELSGLSSGYVRDSAGKHVSRYSTTGQYFYLLNGGEAVNFIHGASVGPFVFLVQAEILAGAAMLARGGLDAGMYDSCRRGRERRRRSRARCQQAGPARHRSGRVCRRTCQIRVAGPWRSLSGTGAGYLSSRSSP